jgi:hypothetical protein
MKTKEIVNKINEIVAQLESKKAEQKILVMHPSAILMVKDKITEYHNIHNTGDSLVFDGKIPLFLSFCLPINHFAFMTLAEYETHYKP